LSVSLSTSDNRSEIYCKSKQQQQFITKKKRRPTALRREKREEQRDTERHQEERAGEKEEKDWEEKKKEKGQIMKRMFIVARSERFVSMQKHGCFERCLLVPVCWR
jgi:hypothetical protein